MSNLTASIGRFAADTSPMPPAALRAASAGIVDAIGAMIAGAREPVVTSAIDTLVGDDASGPSTLLATRRQARSIDAAFVNGTAAHVLAMDDVAAGCHPSAVLMPALLAEAEAIGASGSDLLRAYVVGFEVLVELAKREPDALHSGGWHPTGLLGPVAAAAAVANLRGLDAGRCANAVGIAASLSGGLQANFGTQTKALHIGRAASSGVLAARLAARGVDAARDALEHPKGLLRTVSPHGRVDVERPFEVDRANPRLMRVGLGIKKYPVCYTTHRLVDAAIDVATRHALSPADIARVDVTVGAAQAAMARHRDPRTPLEAKYSVEFAVASGLIARAAGFAELRPSFVDSPAVRALMARTVVALDERRSDDDPVFGPADRVIVTTTDGTVVDSGPVAFARGHASCPLPAEGLRAKFLDCVRSGGRDDGERLYVRVMGLASLADVRTLVVDDTSLDGAGDFSGHDAGTGTIISSARCP